MYIIFTSRFFSLSPFSFLFTSLPISSAFSSWLSTPLSPTLLSHIYTHSLHPKPTSQADTYQQPSPGVSVP